MSTNLGLFSREELDEFKRITFNIKGFNLSDEAAADQGERLVQSFLLILSMMKRRNKEENIYE